MRLNATLGTLATLALITACHQNSAPQATSQDIESAKQDAQREVAAARAEASKDIKSAAKVGTNSRDIVEAKVIGSYDVAMVKADGDHKIAVTKCMSLQVDMQQACKDQADADYETAKATAKATRLGRPQ